MNYKLLFVLCLLAQALFANPSAAELKVLQASEHRYDGYPALGIIFNSALDPGVDYNQFITVNVDEWGSVDGAWVLDKGRHMLYFPHVEPAKTYLVELAAKLPALDRRTLGGTSSHSIKTAAREPFVGFNSQGVILPAKANRGLPIRSYDTDAIDLDFFRINHRQAYKFINDRHNYERFLTLRDEHSATLVYSGRFELGLGINQEGVSRIDLSSIDVLNRPGMYVAVLRQPGRYSGYPQSTYFFISDLGLHLRRYARAGRAYLHSLATAQPLPDVTLHLLNEQGEAVDITQTGQDGSERIDIHQGKYLLAKQGNDFVIMAVDRAKLDFSDFAIDGREYRQRELFVYSPRDLYRPGEQAVLSVLLRDQDGRPTPGQPLSARITRPDGKEFMDFSWSPRVSGYYQKTINLPAGAQTGQWQLQLRFDPSRKQADKVYAFRVEEFLPERMKLQLSSAKKGLSTGEPFQVTVQGDYLYGAPADGNRFDGKVILQAARKPLPQYPDVWFGRDKAFKPLLRDIPEQTLDSSGSLEIPVSTADAPADRPVSVKVTGNLYESGGRPVTRSLQRIIWPAERQIGIKPRFDIKRAGYNTPVSFEIMAADRNGRRVTADDLQVVIWDDTRRYVWVRDDDDDWHSEIIHSPVPVKSQNLSIAADKTGQVTFTTEYGDYRIEITDPETGLLSSVKFYGRWRSQGERLQRTASRPDSVALSLDKLSYTPGEDAWLDLKSPHQGVARIFVESDRLMWSTTVEVKAGSQQIRVPIRPHWNRHDIYVSAVVFRPAGHGEDITPARSAGVIHLPIQRDDQRLSITIESVDRQYPERPLVTKVQVNGHPTLKGQPIHVTLAAVDVGVLSITGFETPDPLEYFFGKRRYSVESHDQYGRIIEAAAGRVAKLRFGGDGVEIRDNPGGKRPEAKVKIVSLFSGLVQFDHNGQAEIALDVPDFNGRLRLMALAFGESSFAAADREVTIAAPVVAEISMPRFIAPGDESQLTVELHNVSGKPQLTEFSVSAQHPLILESTTRQRLLRDGEKWLLKRPLGASSGVREMGVGKVFLSVNTDKAFSQERQWELSVRPAWPITIRRRQTRLDVGEALYISDHLYRDLIAEGTKVQLMASAAPALDIGTALAGLNRYPYGCLEQTTSKAWPQLYTTRERALTFGFKPIGEKQRRKQVEGAIQRLQGMQRNDGGFGLWNNTSPEEIWLSAYVTDFLLTAQEKGYSVPADMLADSVKRLKHRLRRGNERLDHLARDYRRPVGFAARAYAGYVLSRMNQAPLSSLRTLYDHHREAAASGLPLLHLALALREMGDHRRADEAAKLAVNFKADAHYHGYYGSKLRDSGMMLWLLEREGWREIDDSRLIEIVQNELKNRHYFSTQERFALFMAGITLAEREQQPISLLLEQPGKQQWRDFPDLQTFQWGADEIRCYRRLTNLGESPVYFNLTVSGFSKDAPGAQANGISIERILYDLDGEEIFGDNLKAGEMVIARLIVNAGRYLQHALLVDLIPAGMEIENLHLGQGLGLGDVSIDGRTLDDPVFNTRLAHSEYREDRFVAALQGAGGWYRGGRTQSVFYLMRAVTPGSYAFPPPHAEDMYRAETQGIGETPGRLIIRP